MSLSVVTWCVCVYIVCTVSVLQVTGWLWLDWEHRRRCFLFCIKTASSFQHGVTDLVLRWTLWQLLPLRHRGLVSSC